MLNIMYLKVLTSIVTTVYISCNGFSFSENKELLS